MGIALKELFRQPARFVPVGGALTLLVVLLVILGGFLDGLELNQTGPYRAHEDRLLVFADDSELLIQRSRVGPEARTALSSNPATGDIGSLNQVVSTASLADGTVVDIVLFGHDIATATIPRPSAESAVIDKALADQQNVEVGDLIGLGPTAEPAVVTTIVDDLSLGSPTVWLSSTRWRDIVQKGNAAALLPAGVEQALVLEPAAGNSLADLQAAVAGTPGITAATATEVVDSLPVVQQQSSTFEGIIGVTFVVTLLVVALFFALITLERVGLYAVLKALGARTKDLLAGISAQAVCVSVIALAAGFGLSLGFTSLLPDDLPVRLVPARLAQIGVGVIVTSLLGSLFTLRRILRIDPAEAIG